MKNNGLKKIHYVTSFGTNIKNDWCDIIVTLNDGRAFSFTVETINSILQQMDETREEYFFEQGLLIVNKMNKKIIKKMILDILKNDDIEKYGVLQI